MLDWERILPIQSIPNTPIILLGSALYCSIGLYLTGYWVEININSLQQSKHRGGLLNSAELMSLTISMCRSSKIQFEFYPNMFEQTMRVVSPPPHLILLNGAICYSKFQTLIYSIYKHKYLYIRVVVPKFNSVQITVS